MNAGAVYALLGAAGGVGASIVGLLAVSTWWQKRRTEQDRRLSQKARHDYESEIQGSFVYEIATNHLPHLYDGLRLIAERLDVHLPDPPPIKYLPFEPGKERQS